MTHDMTRETKAGEQELVSTNTLHNAARPLLQTHLAAPRHRASMRDLLEVAQAASAGSLFAKSKGAKRGHESCEDELTHKRAHNGQTHCDDMGKLNRQKTKLCNGYSFTVTLQSGQL